MNDSIEELQIQVRELNERLRTWEVAAAEERERCVTSHYLFPCQLVKGRHQELARIMDRVVEIGLRGGAWAEVQNDTPPPSPSNSIQPHIFFSTLRAYSERSVSAVSSSNDT